MSIPDRLFMLAQQYRDQYGVLALMDAARMIPHLSSQAPDLYVEIRALSAAIIGNAAGRIAQAADPASEEQAIAVQIATEQSLALASVTPSVEVARRLGIDPISAPPAPPVGDSWAGDSVIVGLPTPPPPATPAAAPPNAESMAQNAATPFWQNKWAVGIGAAALFVLGYQQFSPQAASDGAGTGGPQIPGAPTTPGAPIDPNAPVDPNAPIGPNSPTGPNDPAAPIAPRPTGQPRPNAPTGGGQQFPALASPNGPQPMLAVQSTQNGFMVGFMLNGVAGMVSSPQGGWDNGPGGIMLSRNPQSQQPDAIGGGSFQAINSGGNPARLMQVQWQQDKLNIGPVCVAFIGNGGQDVNPRGARMCIMDGSCNRPLGCGQLPAGQ